MGSSYVGGRVWVGSSGAGSPLVLLHSLLADAASFARVVPPLSEHFGVHVPDLPGFGRSQPVDGGLTAVADRIASTVRALAGSRPAIGLGNGYGGFVLLQAALRHPGLFDRLIFADCGACFSEPGREAFRTMARVSEEKGLEALAETAMRRLFPADFQADNPDLLRERRAAFLRMDPSVFRTACEALAGLDLRPMLREIHVPALVLVGEQDKATPPAMARELANGLPNARFVQLPGCAHVPQLQAPDAFLREVMAFLGTDRGPA